MEYSASNTALWNIIVQMGIIAGMILFANVLRRKLPFVKKSLMPTAVLAGFILLLLRNVGILNIETGFLEMLTYHGIALGFIALSLRVPQTEKENFAGILIGPKSGALIVSTYLVQALIGLVISISLSYTIMPNFFKASGILLAMGYGQGPGQANNVGSIYEGLGFIGGRSYALSIAASGYLCACIVGVIYINILSRKGKLNKIAHDDISGSITVDTFQDKDEIPVSESMDKLSVQVALILLVYLVTYLAIRGITSLTDTYAPGISSTISPLLWGFNFIVGSMFAILFRTMFRRLRKIKVITRQYQNNYLLSRISGLAFDLMIVAGISSIDIADVSGLWLPFIITSVVGAIVTYVYLEWICKWLYPTYYHEGFTSMFGMLTGTISSGVLLLREIDPDFETPAANNLLTGSSFGIFFGAPMLILIGLAPRSTALTFITLGLCAVYLVILTLFMLKVNPRRKS